jgi:hypothetical protein
VPGLWSVIVIVTVCVAAAWLLGRLGLSPYRFNTVPDPAAKAERST